MKHPIPTFYKNGKLHDEFGPIDQKDSINNIFGDYFSVFKRDFNAAKKELKDIKDNPIEKD